MINLYLLLVDDESDIRQTVAASLSLDPFFILRDCASGAETLAAAVAWRPDLILLDVMMTDMDGPTVLGRLRADRRTAPIPVVFFTARAEGREHQRLRALGAAGVIANRSIRCGSRQNCAATLPSRAFFRLRARVSCDALRPTPVSFRITVGAGHSVLRKPR